MNIEKILQIVTGSETLGKSSLPIERWKNLFEELLEDSEVEFTNLVSNQPGLFDVCLDILFKEKDSGFYTMKGWFNDKGTSDCCATFEESEYYSPETTTGVSNKFAWFVANYLVENCNWYSPDGGYNVYKRKSDFEKYVQE